MAHHTTGKIIPAILEPDQAAVAEKVSAITEVVPVIQIDAMDGTYAPEHSWPLSEPATDISLPENWPAIELDLLVDTPEQYRDIITALAPKRVVVHTTNKEQVAAVYASLADEVELGVGVQATDSIALIEPIADMLHFVQCMGITEIGKQGQAFTPAVIPQIRALKKRYPQLARSVDGGVSEKTLPDLVTAGADRFAVGSAVWKGDPVENINTLESLL